MSTDRDEANLEQGVTREDLRALLDLLAGSDLEELEVEHDGMRIRVRREPSRMDLITPMATENNGESLPAAEDVANGLQVVTSPWVGVFYAGVKPGDVVETGQAVGTVEALRMHHPVQCETVGVVEEILVQDGHAVEYGQALMRFRPESAA